jgi:phosphoribosylformylglycinamidine cyclo-ligase
VVLAFASSGLHTNGYSLARKLLFDIGKLSVESYVPELQRMLGEVLLEPHINYTRPVLHLLKQQVAIKGMAHITGGGLLENIPRILPTGCSVEIKKSAWPLQPLFSLLAQLGKLDETECYRTFNMGVGLIMIGDPSIADTIRAELNPEFKLYLIGQVVKGDQKVLLCE